jgi:hypothetical protein
MLRNSPEQAQEGGQEGEVSMTTPLIATVVVGLNRMFNVTGHGRNQGTYKSAKTGSRLAPNHARKGYLSQRVCFSILDGPSESTI